MTDHLQSLLDALGWDDDVDHDDDGISRVDTSFVIGGLAFGLTLWLDPVACWFHILLVSPVSVDDDQHAAALALCNEVNNGLAFGRFSVRNTRVNFKHGVDYEGVVDPLPLMQTAFTAAASSVEARHPGFMRLLPGAKAGSVNEPAPGSSGPQLLLN